MDREVYQPAGCAYQPAEPRGREPALRLAVVLEELVLSDP